MVKQQQRKQSSGKAYLKVVDGVREHISEKNLEEGDPLPTMEWMSEEFGVGLGAVKRALQDLRIAGVIYSVQGKGSFVLDPAAVVEPSPERSLPDSPAATIQALEDQLRSLTARVERFESLMPHLEREAAVT